MSRESERHSKEELPKEKKVIRNIFIVMISLTVIVGGVFVARDVIKIAKINEIGDISTSFEDGALSYDEAIEKLNSYSEIDSQKVQEAITKEKAELDSLKESVEAYYGGIAALQLKDYMGAATSFNKVAPDFKYYDDARAKIDDNKSKCRGVTQARIKSSLEKEDYQGALEAAIAYLDVYADEEIEAQKAKIVGG